MVPPIISDRTAPALAGLEGRAFREFILARGIPHTTHGHRLLARTADVLEAIGRTVLREVAPAAIDDGREPAAESADAVLAACGMKRKAS